MDSLHFTSKQRRCSLHCCIVLVNVHVLSKRLVIAVIRSMVLVKLFGMTEKKKKSKKGQSFLRGWTNEAQHGRRLGRRWTPEVSHVQGFPAGGINKTALI